MHGFLISIYFKDGIKQKAFSNGGRNLPGMWDKRVYDMHQSQIRKQESWGWLNETHWKVTHCPFSRALIVSWRGYETKDVFTIINDVFPYPMHLLIHSEHSLTTEHYQYRDYLFITFWQKMNNSTYWMRYWHYFIIAPTNQVGVP